MGVVTSSHFAGRKCGKGHTVNNGASKQSPASWLWTGPPHIPDFRRFQMGILTLTNEKDCLDHGWKEVPKSHYKRWLEGIFQGRDEGKRIQAGRSLFFTHIHTMWAYVVTGWPLCRLKWHILYLYAHPYRYGESYNREQERDSHQNPATRSKARTGAICENKTYTTLSLLLAHSHHFPPLFTEHTDACWHLLSYMDFPISSL